jgi:hypothetical protein
MAPTPFYTSGPLAGRRQATPWDPYNIYGQLDSQTSTAYRNPGAKTPQQNYQDWYDYGTITPFGQRMPLPGPLDGDPGGGGGDPYADSDDGDLFAPGGLFGDRRGLNYTPYNASGVSGNGVTSWGAIPSGLDYNQAPARIIASGGDGYGYTGSARMDAAINDWRNQRSGGDYYAGFPGASGVAYPLIPGYASGGNPEIGKASRLAERGYEIAIFGGNATVLPHELSQEILGSGGGAAPNVTVIGDGGLQVSVAPQSGGMSPSDVKLIIKNTLLDDLTKRGVITTTLNNRRGGVSL